MINFQESIQERRTLDFCYASDKKEPCEATMKKRGLLYAGFYCNQDPVYFHVRLSSSHYEKCSILTVFYRLRIDSVVDEFSYEICFVITQRQSFLQWFSFVIQNETYLQFKVT